MPEIPTPKPSSAGPSRPSWAGWAVLFVLLAGMWAWQLMGQEQRDLPNITYSAFYAMVEQGKVASVTVSGQSVRMNVTLRLTR